MKHFLNLNEDGLRKEGHGNNLIELTATAFDLLEFAKIVLEHLGYKIIISAERVCGDKHTSFELSEKELTDVFKSRQKQNAKNGEEG